jgi:thiol-disulfide isomerase/thioredoxin
LELAIKLSFLTPYTKVTKDDVALAEKYLAQLNGLSDAVLLNKVKAYDKIGGYYGWADVDEKVTEYVNKVLTLSKKISPDERKAIGQELIWSYIDLARVYGNREEIDQALAALRKGLDELADIPTAKETINNAIESYLLVGQPAAPIEAEHWLNAEAGTKRVDLRGQVTLLQFAAHWCAPCAKSYPAMLNFHEQFAKQGLRVMFVTKTYGYFGERSGLTPEEELAANREYYVEHHGLPFKIAMSEWKMDAPREANSANRDEANEARYLVSGYPTIIVADKQGIIRLKMGGWDPANETRLTRLIEKLLAAPAPKDKS